MRLSIRVWAIVSTAVLSSSIVFAQGDLNPPGAPAPTLKTLHQVEPRIDLGSVPGTASNNIEITESGSYYLSSNLVVTTSVGIQVLASDVLVDLNGFQITRSGGGIKFAIVIEPGLDNITVLNGSVNGAFTHGIYCSGLSGSEANNVTVVDVSVASCSKAMTLADYSSVRNCRVQDTSQGAITTGDSSEIKNCVITDVSGNTAIYTGRGSLISGCLMRSNAVVSSIVYTTGGTKIENCVLNQNRGKYGIRGEAGTLIRECNVSWNGLDRGIDVDDGSSVIDSVVSHNEGDDDVESYGIYAEDASLVDNCVVIQNDNTNGVGSTYMQGVGIFAGERSTVRNCLVNFNRGDGILFEDECLIQDNAAGLNGSGGDGAGLHGIAGQGQSRIEGNNVVDNDRGIELDGSWNFVVKNTASANGVNYEIAASNLVGTIIAPSNSYAITGGSITGAVGVAPQLGIGGFGGEARDDSWANFSF